jgi:branched-chain amino acid transport system substrate-binding protein
MINRARFTVALASLMPTLASTASAQTASGTPYKIGMLYPLTGAVAAVTAEHGPAVDIAVEEVNRAGGVNGHPLQIIREDTQASPQGGLAAMRKVVQVDGVQALITIYTNVVTAQIPLADELKVPFICPIQVPGILANSQYGFAHSFVFSQIAPMIAGYWRGARVKRIFAVVPNNGYGQVMAPALRSTAREAGADYNEALANLSEADFRGVLTRAKEYNPDQIVIALQGSTLEGVVVKQARELGITTQILDVSGVQYQARTWRAAIGPYSEGMIFAGLRVDPKLSRDFVHAYRARTGSEPSYDAVMVYDDIKMFAYAIKRGGYSGEAIRTALSTLQGVPSALGGTITMKPDHYTQVSSVGMFQVRKGELVPVPIPKS